MSFYDICCIIYARKCKKEGGEKPPSIVRYLKYYHSRIFLKSYDSGSAIPRAFTAS